MFNAREQYWESQSDSSALWAIDLHWASLLWEFNKRGNRFDEKILRSILHYSQIQGNVKRKHFLEFQLSEMSNYSVYVEKCRQDSQLFASVNSPYTYKKDGDKSI